MGDILTKKIYNNKEDIEKEFWRLFSQSIHNKRKNIIEKILNKIINFTINKGNFIKSFKKI